MADPDPGPAYAAELAKRNLEVPGWSRELTNRFTAAMPADPDLTNRRRQVFGACYSRVLPTPVSRPRAVAVSTGLMQRLGIPTAASKADWFAEVFGGNRLLTGMDPFAMCYGGHQFGNWAGQLGDGRAINLGEIRTAEGEFWTLQLKGAGPTPYSRTADGLAVLRSSLREFLCSEAMESLGVPTTRALSLVLTGDQVVRDMFYDGRPKAEPGAVVCRVAPSFIRFGNFEILAARRDLDTLRQLAGFTMQADSGRDGDTSPAGIVDWFRGVCQSTARLIAEWMRVGFVHGVMNTDNMSILGLTIDYGPYGWLEEFDPDWTPNTTDSEGRRYCFGAQPEVALWNLVQLANALYPLVGEAKPLEEALGEYSRSFRTEWNRMMAAKLGWTAVASEEDQRMVEDLQSVLQGAQADFTLFYRQLADVPASGESLRTSASPGSQQTSSAESGLPTGDNPDPVPDWMLPLVGVTYLENERTSAGWLALRDWVARWRNRVALEGVAPDQRRAGMNRVNPRFVPRNYLAQEAIELAEQGDFGRLHELMELFQHPYDDQPGKEQFAAKRPEWARHRAGCSMLSCSS